MEIRKLTPADEAVMLSLLTSREIAQTYLLPEFELQEDARPLFQRLLTLSQEDAHFVRGICAEGELVGFLNDVEMENGALELGYVIHPAHWNKCYATAALRLAIDEAFRLGYQEVVCGAFSENTASLRVMEKAGMTPIFKTDEIEYRGSIHRCRYCAISALELVIPTPEELSFRQELLSDEATMSYNHAYGGAIGFPEERWRSWYDKWVAARDPHYFYRYLYSRILNTCVGEAAYHYDPETGRWLCDVIVHAKYRGQGFGRRGLHLLCQAAKANGLEALHDEILLDNPSIQMFLRSGFQEVGRTEEARVVRKEL